MCLTAEALVLFLNIVGAEAVTTRPDRIIVHAETRDAHWIARGDQWCTEARRLDAAARFAALARD